MTTSSTLQQIATILLQRKLTLATAESCTGGLISHLITNMAGSSAYYVGGVVAYSYDAKERLLGVHHGTLYDHGAVSREVAIEMAHGARRELGADIAISATGIAGPGGGLPNKPVGLVWLALSAREEEIAQKHIWDQDREGNKMLSANAGLEMLLEFLKKETRETGR